MLYVLLFIAVVVMVIVETHQEKKDRVASNEKLFNYHRELVYVNEFDVSIEFRIKAIKHNLLHLCNTGQCTDWLLVDMLCKLEEYEDTTVFLENHPHIQKMLFKEKRSDVGFEKFREVS